jgi:small-conductance mechanosensitive channel
MDTLVFSKWLAQLGVQPWLIVAFVQPLTYLLVAFLAREIVLRLALRRESREERRRLWRRVSRWLAVLLAIVATGVAWRTVDLDWLVADLGEDFDTTQLRDHLEGAMYAVVSTAILVFVLFLIRQGRRALLRRLDAWMASHETIRFQRAPLVSRQRLQHTLQLGLRVVHWALVIGAFAVYGPLLLSFFPATAPYADQLMPYVRAPFARAADGVIGYMPRLLTLIVIVVVARYLLKLLRAGMKAVERKEITLPGFDPEWGDPTFRLMRIAVILLTIVVSYPYLPGAGSEVFKGFSVFIAAVITLGSTAAINNIISGVVLTYTRSFHVGDRVKIGETLGDITEKGLFVTRIRALGNEMVTIPNGKVLGGDVTNLSEGADGKGLSVLVSAGIGYDVDWRKVHELMKEAARNTPGIEADPEPFVVQTDLGDYAVSYLLIGKTLEPKRQLLIGSDLRQNVLDVFSREGIEIMTPSVTAIRDANQPAIPEDYKPRPLQIPGLQVLSVNRNSE